jgi:hypothetical protein
MKLKQTNAYEHSRRLYQLGLYQQESTFLNARINSVTRSRDYYQRLAQGFFVAKDVKSRIAEFTGRCGQRIQRLEVRRSGLDTKYPAAARAIAESSSDTNYLRHKSQHYG